MNLFSFSSLRFRLLLLVLFAIIPALALTLYSGLEQRRHAAEHVQDDSLQLARHVSAEQERMIEGVRQSLYILAQLPQVRECNKATCSRLFGELLKQYPHYLNIGAATLDGNIFASAIPITRTVNIFDRPYFQQALKTRKFAIGEYQIGRIVGKPVVNFGYPVIGETRNVTAVVFVALDLTWLNQLAAQVQLPNGSTLTLIDHKGTILARYPEAEKWVGKIMPEVSIIKTILAQGQGMAETIGLDGIQRLYTFTSVSKAAQTSGKVTIAVGIPSSVAFAQVNKILIRNLILLGLVALLALVAAWIVGDLLVLKRVNPIVSAANRLSCGDLSARTGITCGKGEFSQLAHTFDEMASSLENRETDRKRAEDALRQSERKFRDLYDNAPVGYQEYDKEGHITNVNHTELEILGYTLEEIVGQPVWKFAVEEETSRQAAIAKLAGTMPPGRGFEQTFRRKDGTTVPVLIEDRILRDEEGHIVGIRSTIHDITERKRAEEALGESEEKFRAMTATAADAITMMDNQGCITYWNPTAERMFGYAPQEVIGKELHLILAPQRYHEAYKKGFEKFRTTGLGIAINNTLEFIAVRKDGTEFPMEVSTSAFKLKGQWHAVGIIRDITERMQAEEAMRKSEEESKKLARENAAMAEIGRIISSTLNIDEVYERFTEEVRKLIPFDRIMINIINPNKKTVTFAYITGINIAGRQIGDVVPLAGTATEGVMRTRSSLLVQTENIEEVARRFPGLLPSFQAGLRSIIFVPLISKNLFIGALSLRSTKPNAYTDKDTKVTESIGVQIAGAIANAQLFAEHIRSEEEKVVLQEQLRQSQKMEAVGQLAGGIAHDFNNLLTIIKGYSQLSLLDLKENDPLWGNIQEIQKATHRATDLTRQLLAFSRRQILDLKVLDLNTLLKDLDKMLRRIIGEDIELTNLLTENLGRVKIDPGQFEQMILNLAVNARDAMPSGGKLTIETANVELDEEYARTHISVTPGPYVRLSVSDTGVGIPMEVKEKVFEPFFTTKEKGKGTGLGLSTVYGIVKQSGGNIWVYSEPGYGTTFKIYLPRVEEDLDTLHGRDETDSLPRGSETVLLVEDEPSVRDLAHRLLNQQGYKVLEAANGKEALRVVLEHIGEKIHLLLTDVVMPRMGGKELADQLKILRPDIKVLYASGYTDNAIVHHGVLERGTNFLQKPFSPKALSQKVREVLDR